MASKEKCAIFTLLLTCLFILVLSLHEAKYILVPSVVSVSGLFYYLCNFKDFMVPSVKTTPSVAELLLH